MSDNKYGPYVLVTAAHNEERHIEGTLRSVVDQTVLPLKWVIVNDRSTDRTGEIIGRYQAGHGFIEQLMVKGDDNRNFGAQVRAINRGVAALRGLEYEFIGNLDADVSFGPRYFEPLMETFARRPALGLTGGTICEEEGGVFRPRKLNNPRSVAHAVQFFRRRCFEDVGGYRPLKYGGPDWLAEVSARMSGWEVQSMLELEVRHHRPTSGAEGSLRGALRQGLMAYSLGSHPVFEALRCARRFQSKPFLLYSLFRLSSFLWATIKNMEREAPGEFVRYLRQEQTARMWKGICGLVPGLFERKPAQRHNTQGG